MKPVELDSCSQVMFMDSCSQGMFMFYGKESSPVISLLYTKPVDAFKHLRNRWVKFAMNTKQYNLGIFRKKKRFRIILESLRSPLNQERTVVLLLQAVTQDVLPRAAVLCKFEGCGAFPNSTGYYSDMDGFEWELDCTSKFFSFPLPVGSD